jgi:glycine betaine monooxygenase A
MWMGSRGYRPEYVEALRQAYTHGGPLEREFYLSSEILNADIDRVWPRHWLYVGHDCVIARPGDWMTWQVGHDTIVVVRNKDNSVRAFHNTCRHRGARICEGERGNTKLFVCPYHAWTYALDGQLRTSTTEEFGIDRSALGLHPVAIQNLNGLLFVALGPEPVPFHQGATEIAAQMAHQGFADAKLAHKIRYTVKANWKLVFENNRECYHCAHAHPEYVRGTYDVSLLDPEQRPEVERQTRAHP